MRGRSKKEEVRERRNERKGAEERREGRENN